MAAVDMTVGGILGHPSRRNKKSPYMIRERFTGAAAAVAKGSALAAADTIKVLDLPANTLILAAGLEVITANTSATLTLDLGVTGGDVDQYVDGLDGTVAGIAPAAATPGNTVVGATADTLDVLLATMTTAVDDGVFEVWALLLDILAYPAIDSAKGSQGQVVP